MNQNLEKIANENLFVLTPHQMNYQIDKLRCKMPFGLKNFSIRAYILKQYFKLFYGYIPEEKK
ncbi:MAG TPA: hypothetical protein VJA20_00600 [Candidatus Nanoarchaeia archaeon]|nr:hypothetical protein [Candidatus Nanoarchaeia archaeon]